MFESNPLPIELLVLWFTLPGIWLGAAAITDTLAADRGVRRFLRPAVALAAWIVAVQFASTAARSFYIGLPAGMVALSIGGLVLWWNRRRANAAGDLPTDKPGPRFDRGMWLSMIVVTAPIAIMSFLGHFHDDLLPNGHLSFVAQLQNKYFPPRLLGFPHIPLRYHYGFDLVCAGLTALTRLRTDLAIQIVTIVGWAYAWCVLWVLGQRITESKRGGMLTAAATLLGGGLVILLAPVALHRFANADTPLRALLGMYSVGDGLRLRTIVFEYFFQHPFSLGFPLLAATLLVVSCGAENGKWSRYVLLALLLASLSLVQDIVCITLTATLAFTEIIVARRWKFIFVLICVVAAAIAGGGLLSTKIPDAPPMGLYLRFWFAEKSSSLNPGRVLLWHLITFFPLLPLGIFGARRIIPALRWPLLLLAAGALATPVFVGYAYSADILKFSAVALFALGILAGAGLVALAEKNGTAWRIAFGACLFATMMSAIVAIAGILAAQFGHIKALATYYEGPVALGKDDRQAVSWLRRHAGPDDGVYRIPEIAIGYCQSGGLSSTAEATNTLAFGVPKDRAAAQKNLLLHLPADLEAYRAEGIVWFVVAPDDPKMLRSISKWLQDGMVEKKADFGSLQIYKTVEPSKPASKPTP